jgi:hypothetical protein
VRYPADVYLAAALVGCLAAAAYWVVILRRDDRGMARGPVALPLALAAAGIAMSLWSALADRPSYTFARDSSPVAIAIAFDLSPSMLAVPHPELDGPYPARFERAQTVLVDLLRGIEERRESVIVGILGFTKQADILMGWDQGTVQARDILRFAVSPDLLGSSGTSFEAGVKSLNKLFSMLPDEARASSRKIAIIVSDGEDTMRASSFGYATSDIESGDFDVIALQAGLLDRSEGIASFDAAGQFTGFRSMGGSAHTVPDAAAMTALAAAAADAGLYVRAEAQDSVQRMLDFTLAGGGRAGGTDPALLSTFGMFAVVSLLCALIIR